MMNEEQKKTEAETKPQEANANANDGISPQKKENSDLIGKAERLVDVLENAEKRLTSRMFEFEKKIAEQILAGRSEIGKFKSEEEKIQDQADAIVDNYMP